MPDIPLQFPFGGRLDSASQTDKPQLYTSQARNVRARDPITGELRGARRSALTKWNEDPIGSGPIRAMISTSYDDRKLSYSFTANAGTERWSSALPSKGTALEGRTDSQGNIYVVDGNAGVAKYNSAGRLVLKMVLPVIDQAHIVRALWVDDGGKIYAGVSAGGDVVTAQIFCILQLLDDQYTVLWSIDTEAYCESLRVFRGTQLFAALNYPQENKSRVLIYEGIGLSPEEVRRIESVAYPINDMTISDAGEVYCASPEVDAISNFGSVRPGPPGTPNIHAPIVGWTIYDLPNARERIWSYYDAESIDVTDVEQTGTEPELIDGQTVLRWRDLSGNGRHWYANSSVIGETGPTLRMNGVGGLKSIYFDQSISGAPQSMQTAGNASTSRNVASQQRTAIPSYEGSMCAIFLLVRPTQDATPASPAPRVLLYNENEFGSGLDHSVWINSNGSGVAPGSFTTGTVAVYSESDAGDPEVLNVFDYLSEAENTGCTLITIVRDGQIDGGDTTVTRSMFRINGKPIDRFEGLPFESTVANFLGYAPTIGAAAANKFQGEIMKMLVLDRADRFDDATEPKLLTHDQLERGDTSVHQTDTEICRIEAWMMYERGLALTLEERKSAPLPPNRYAHFYARTVSTNVIPGPPAPTVGGINAAFTAIIESFPLTSKHDSQGLLRWVCNEETYTDTGVDAGGVGYAVVERTVEDSGAEIKHIYMAGASDSSGTGTAALRKVIDTGGSFSDAQADGGWRHQPGVAFSYTHPRMAADQFGNLFVPGNGGGVSLPALLVLEKDPDGSGDAVTSSIYLRAGSPDSSRAIVLPPDNLIPDYRTDIADQIADVSYLLGPPSTSLGPVGALVTSEAVLAIEHVTSNPQASGTPRTVTTLAVVEDDIHLVTATTNSIPTGGTASLDATAQYIQVLRAGDDIVFIDGVRYLAYSLRDGTITDLVSTSSGEIPPRGKVGMYWRHRLVIGAFADNPYNYAASRLGNIRDWNTRPGFFPTGEAIRTSTQSFNGTLTRAGEAADVIVAMIPVWDDLAFIVGESRILRLTGDPQDGGNIHTVTDSMGGVFGDSWCVDAQGRVFIFGNKPPGLYQLQSEGDPVPLTRHTLEESEFALIDFSTHRIMLTWNPIDRGVHIFQVAWSDNTVVNHWFWEEKTHGSVKFPPLWTDRFYHEDRQPSAAAYLGGDDTRCLLLGCHDGYIRKWDPSATTDDGDPVDGYFMAKLTPPGGPRSEWVLKEIQIALGKHQGGARLEIFASDDADDTGPIQSGYDLQSGLNESTRIRQRGKHIWCRVRSAASSRWAYESGSYTLVAHGKQIPGN